ncbi:MAG: hypothetical protein V3T82_09260, partial [Nitrospinaceae bacterium]
LFGIPQSYIAGSIVTNGPGDFEHDVFLTRGESRSSASKFRVGDVDNTIIKKIDVNWVVGNGLGGFPSALTLAANTWYHVFRIQNPTTLVSDAGYDTALDAANLRADAVGFTEYRRVGSVLTDGVANIIPLIAHEIGGGAVLYSWVATPADDKNGAIATGPRETIGLTVPTGYKVQAIFTVNDNGSGGGGTTLFSDLAIDDEVIDQATGKLGQLATISSANRDGAQPTILTDVSGQIGGRAQSAKTIRIQTVGWIDFRRA